MRSTMVSNVSSLLHFTTPSKYCERCRSACVTVISRLLYVFSAARFCNQATIRCGYPEPINALFIATSFSGMSDFPCSSVAYFHHGLGVHLSVMRPLAEGLVLLMLAVCSPNPMPTSVASFPVRKDRAQSSSNLVLRNTPIFPELRNHAWRAWGRLC